MRLLVTQLCYIALRQRPVSLGFNVTYNLHACAGNTSYQKENWHYNMKIAF